MGRLSPLLAFAVAVRTIGAADVPRPRGVGPEFAKFYKDAETFTCISNPSIHLSTSQINDDFCDCPDGSDEPGTSACSYLSPLSPPQLGAIPVKDTTTSLALPGFYCKNKGHQPSYISFSRVNDGVCDYDLCCDGSDEWAKVGGKKCEDKCKEIGKEWRKQDEARQKSLGEAARRRKELVSEASRLRQQVQDRIQSLESEIKGSELKFKGLETDLTETERQERGKVVKKPKQGGKLGSLVQIAKDRIEELRNSLVLVRDERDMAIGRIAELESVLSSFKEEYNPNFNDEGVKRAVRSWEDYAARDKQTIGDTATNRDLDEIAKEDSETEGINWKEWNESEESDVDVLYRFEEYLPTPARDWLDGKLRALRIIMVENGILAPSRDPGGESKALEDARSALRAAEDDVEAGKRQLNEHSEDLAKDYGMDDVFRALKDQCISKDSGEYTYELCWLGQTKQKSKKGGAHTTMGNFVSIDSTIVDDELPADGKGLGSGERVTLKYENGQHCWNGPNRSTMVVLACAEKDEIWKIVEEEKCVYRMEVGTPAVCGNGSAKRNNGGTRDEL